MPEALEKSDTSPGNLLPATPAYVFRGHTVALHALHFFASNHYLASADADGWVIIWSLATRRPVAVWQAHKGSILGVKSWGNERLVTYDIAESVSTTDGLTSARHGRDHSLRVWQVREADYEGFDRTLPAERKLDSQGVEPWLLHSLAVNALNFCAFAIHDLSASDKEILDNSSEVHKVELTSNVPAPVIIACSNALDSGGIDIFHLPSERRISQIKADPSFKCGMVMAVKLVTDKSNGQLVMASGYEDGHVMMHRRLRPEPGTEWQWQKVYINRPHSQPVLSLDVDPHSQFFISSSADAMLIKHPLNDCQVGSMSTSSLKAINTKHAGQQDVTMRDDGKIFATAGWDARIRVYSSKSMQELAVLKWHKEGCYAVAFSQTSMNSPPKTQSDGSNQSLQRSTSTLAQIKQKRTEKSQQTHWLAAGGKDAKITLWDIY